MELQTVYPFRLPRGYLDAEGTLHREGQMRLATARDELSALRDARVKADANYMTTLVLSQVVTALGTLPAVSPEVIEGLFLSDLEFLQDMYETINKVDAPKLQFTCPHCGESFTDAINFQPAG